MIAGVWPLLKTLLDIIALRKGPDAIPYSWGLTGVVVILWLTVSFVVVLINGGGGRLNPSVPFGGYKRSGIGREHGEEGLNEYLEIKVIDFRAA